MEIVAACMLAILQDQTKLCETAVREFRMVGAVDNPAAMERSQFVYALIYEPRIGRSLKWREPDNAFLQDLAKLSCLQVRAKAIAAHTRNARPRRKFESINEIGETEII